MYNIFSSKIVQGGRFEARNGPFEARFADFFRNWTKFNRNGAFNEAKLLLYIMVLKQRFSYEARF